MNDLVPTSSHFVPDEVPKHQFDFVPRPILWWDEDELGDGVADNHNHNDHRGTRSWQAKGGAPSTSSAPVAASTLVPRFDPRGNRSRFWKFAR